MRGYARLAYWVNGTCAVLILAILGTRIGIGWPMIIWLGVLIGIGSIGIGTIVDDFSHTAPMGHEHG